jgi:hypothetical protein
LSIPTIVKVAVIAPWIHHSWVKPASLEWECIPDLASPCRITLQNLSALPQQDSASQETTGDQEQQNDNPELVTTGSWLVYARQKLEESILQQTNGLCFSHQLFHCNALSPLVCICCCSSHPSLCHRLGRNHPCWLISQWKVFICSLLSLSAGCIISIYCYWSGLTKDKLRSPPS